jgi:hypothetical protein
VQWSTGVIGAAFENFIACPVFTELRFDEWDADSLLIIIIFLGTKKVGYQGQFHSNNLNIIFVYFACFVYFFYAYLIK